MILKSILFLALLQSAFASSKDASAPVKKDKETYAGIAVEEPQDETLKKLMLVPEIKSAYEACKSSYNGNMEKIPNCIWNEQNLSADIKKQVKAFYASESKKKEASPTPNEVDLPQKKDKPTTNLTKRDYNVGTDYKSDPQVQALSTFFGKKLDEVLTGNDGKPKSPDAKKEIVTVDHQFFINLYASELGKSIVNAFTSYCMESDESCRTNKTNCYIKEDPTERKKVIEANLDAIKTATFSEAEGSKWTHCIGTVPKVCYENPNSTADEKYSKDRACLVMDFVKAARKGLLAAEEQKEFYKNLKGGGRSIASNMKPIDGEKEASADNLTELASEDLNKKIKDENGKDVVVADTNKDMLKEVDKCVDSGDNIIDEKKCNKFVDTDKDANEKAFAEFGLKQFAQSDALDEKLNDDKNVASYLKEEGFNQEQIDAMIKDKTTLEEVKKKIKKRFDAEKDTIIKAMAAKLDAKNSTVDSKITNPDGSNIGKIRSELADRSKNLKDMIHFNNIVASYLTVTDSKDKSKQSRNTASLFAEMKDLKGQEAEDFKKRAEASKLKNDKTNVTFGVQELNDFFMKYIDKPKAP